MTEFANLPALTPTVSAVDALRIPANRSAAHPSWYLVLTGTASRSRAIDAVWEPARLESYDRTMSGETGLGVER
jgi:hypothetical protein